MEPRSFERGKVSDGARGHREHDASMEPRSFERGKKPLPSTGAFVRVLQWSRVRLNAERHGRSRFLPPTNRFNGAAFV